MSYRCINCGIIYGIEPEKCPNCGRTQFKQTACACNTNKYKQIEKN